METEKIYTVYKHTTPNNKVYIGITRNNPIQRWLNGKGYIMNTRFYVDINQYGWDNIKHEILFTNLTKEEAEQKEIELIAFYKSNQSEYGYNIESGGHCKGKTAPETIKKLSEMRKGKNNPMYGTHKTEEQKQYLREINLGRKIPYMPRSDETKKKLSLALKGSKRRAKPVIQLDLNGNVIKVWEYAKLASITLNISQECICMCCKGKCKTAGRYKWAYVENGKIPR